MRYTFLIRGQCSLHTCIHTTDNNVISLRLTSKNKFHYGQQLTMANNWPTENNASEHRH